MTPMSSGEYPRSSPDLRRGMLRQRISKTFAMVVGLSMLGLGILLTVPQYFSQRKSMEERARTFSSLLASSVTRSADLYRSTGRLILRDQARRWMTANPDLLRLEVVHVQGFKILVADRHGVHSFPDPATAPEISDPDLLHAVRSLEVTARRIRSPEGAEEYRVVVPSMEEWGRRSYSLVSYFEYTRLYYRVLRSAVEVFLVLLIAVAGAIAVARTLSGAIVSDIEKLRDAVEGFREGNLDEEVRINSGDEVEELADSVNAMARSLKASIEELESAKRELELLDEAKATMVANISHELKTPLTAMAGYLELLQEGQLGPLAEESLHGVTVCRRNLKRLQLRIDELVQLSRNAPDESSGKVFEKIHLGQVLHSVVETLLPDLSSAEVYCSLNLATDLPSIRGNPEEIERVFLNLISNAVKFTPPEGFIRVTAEPMVRDGREGVLVRVADTGIGIPAHALTRIFDRFFQIDPSSSRKHGGMGLGLSLVRRIVSDHGGHVWAESREQQGSTFFIWLPRTKDHSGPYTASGVFKAARGEDPPPPEGLKS